MPLIFCYGKAIFMLCCPNVCCRVWVVVACFVIQKKSLFYNVLMHHKIEIPSE